MSSKTDQDGPWRPLNSTKIEIRVIELSPAQSLLDSIICRLRTVSLLDEPEYEALSYVWGESNDERHILLDGNELPVTDSLFEALVHLRDVKEKRVLWMDALCIHQKDDTEKNIQVTMMGKIYSQASKVLVWLLNSESPGLLDSITSISQNQERHLTQFPLSLLTLMRISWWHRAWTFQEAVLAKNLTFHTGHKHFSLEDLNGYYSSLYKHLTRRHGCCYSLKETISGVQSQESALAILTLRELFLSRPNIAKNKGNLLDLIINNRVRVATKPQDKVYTYLGLADDVPTELVKYGLSLSECVLHISTKLIQHNKSLKIIRYASPSGLTDFDKHRMKGLPSWCPDWTHTPEYAYNMLEAVQHIHLQFGQFAASGNNKADPYFPTPEILGASGVVCDTVKHLGHQSFLPEDSSQTLLQWCHLVANSTSVHDARCNDCDKIIYGNRKKCLSCPDIQLCSRCFNKSRDTHTGHTLTNIESIREDDHYMRGERTKGLSKVEESNKTADSYLPPDNHETKISDFERLSEIDYPFSDDSSIQDAFRRVLVADTFLTMSLLQETSSRDDKSETASLFLKMAFARYWHLKVETLSEAAFIVEKGYTMEPESLASRARDHISIQNVASTMNIAIAQKVLFVSSKGYIGWGPKTMMAGDIIAVLHGGEMPFVLREVSEQLSSTDIGSGYTVIGECYAHGLMRGEALENEEMEKRDFLLY